MNVVQRLVVAYFVLLYFIPLICNVMYSEKIVTIYNVAPLTPSVILLPVGVLGLFLMMSMGPRLRLLPTGWPNSFGRAAARFGASYPRQRLLLAVVSLAMSVPYVASGNGSSRFS